MGSKLPVAVHNIPRLIPTLLANIAHTHTHTHTHTAEDSFCRSCAFPSPEMQLHSNTAWIHPTYHPYMIYMLKPCTACNMTTKYVYTTFMNIVSRLNAVFIGGFPGGSASKSMTPAHALAVLFMYICTECTEEYDVLLVVCTMNTAPIFK